MIDIEEGESWTPYLQQINKLFIDEKQARHDGDNPKLIQICIEIVSFNNIYRLIYHLKLVNMID